jgi:hypothetical protein
MKGNFLELAIYRVAPLMKVGQADMTYLIAYIATMRSVAERLRNSPGFQG